MMQTIDDGFIINLAPNSFKRNSDLFYRVSQRIIEKHIVKNKKYLLALDGIDELEEIYVDMLAHDLHVEFYNLSNSLKEKRELVKNSIVTHMKKGTPFAVENVLKIFYRDSELKEWFDYSGEEGTFRINVLNNTSIVLEEIVKILEIIKKTKRATQQLEKITFESSSHLLINQGLWGRKGTILKHFQEVINLYFEGMNHEINYGNRNIGIQRERGKYGRI
ncbi:phage tail protein I [Fusobacterium necrophorum subsp. funduliforme]|uniref:phage tail protein I n=1 Tax=Fusobacterium necrophorum TaxID=859 RepID=UPI00370E6143